MDLSEQTPRQDLIQAISVWLNSPLPCSSNSSPMPVIPMVYSHSHWFAIGIPALSVALAAGLDQEEVLDETRMCAQLRLLIGLVHRIQRGFVRREQMREFLDALSNLMRCSEKPPAEHVRRLAQKAFSMLLDRFEPIAQYLLLSRLFQLVFQREIAVSESVYEPQLLAWLVDIYRTKCFPSADVNSPAGGDEKAVEAECRSLFRIQLPHFYRQLNDIVYEDPFIAVNFYSAVALLVGSQARNRVQLSLLESVCSGLIKKFRTQLSDWIQLCNVRKKAQTKGDLAAIGPFVTEDKEDDPIRMSILTFQLDEAERQIKKALSE